MRAHEVYNERLKKKKEASRGKARKDEEKARTNEVMKHLQPGIGRVKP